MNWMGRSETFRVASSAWLHCRDRGYVRVVLLEWFWPHQKHTCRMLAPLLERVSVIIYVLVFIVVVLVGILQLNSGQIMVESE